MDKMTFASYKFKPSDVIEGVNRYFAETKANRYRRVPLEIHNGTVKPGNYYVFRNIVFDVTTPKIKESGYYYLICDPEEVVGVAINWLREEHDIFYTPGMEVPVEDFDADEAAKEYEKATRKDIFCEMYHNAIEVLRGNLDYFADLAQKRQMELSNLRYDILKVYREIFDCSNGDPESTDEETLQDILTEYKRTLKLKNVAEEKTIKYKELARENEEKAAKYKDTADKYREMAVENRIQWNNTNMQLQWAQEENRKLLKKYEKLKSELEKYEKLKSELDRYKWLYGNLKNGVESVLQEAEDKED